MGSLAQRIALVVATFGRTSVRSAAPLRYFCKTVVYCLRIELLLIRQPIVS